jgi:small-conductance mechanosensitive channel
VSDQQEQASPLPAAPAEDPQVTIKNLQDQIGSLEEQARLAAEAHAADMNNITALQKENADLRATNEEYQKSVDERWDTEMKNAYAKIRQELLADGKIAINAIEGEAVLLAKDVRSVILEVRNGIQHFETQCHFDTLLQKLGIK